MLFPHYVLNQFISLIRLKVGEQSPMPESQVMIKKLI